MERLLRVCAVLLAVTLVLGSYSIVKLHGISKELSALKGSRDIEQFDVLSFQLAHIGSMLDQIRNDAEIISPMEVIVAPAEAGYVPVHLDWQVKEMRADSTAALYIRSMGELDYAVYSAESTGGGGFRATIHLPYEPVPVLKVTFTESSGLSGIPASRENSGPSRIAASRQDAMPHDLVYDYYISVNSGGMDFSTAVDSIDLSKVSAGETAGLQIDFSAQKKGLLVSMSEIECAPWGIAKFRPVKAWLKVVSEEDTDTIQLECYTGESDHPRKFGATIPDIPATLEQYVLILEYSDGEITKTFEEVIRP